VGEKEMSYTDYTSYSLDPVGRSRFFGIYSGIVVNNSDPSSTNRLQISVPQITGDDFLNWAEPSLINAVVLPAVGDKVWVTFESGDTSYPVWMSGSNSVADAVYGAFSSYVDQSATTGSPKAMQFETTDEANGISIANDNSTSPKKTRITFDTAGTYNIQFSAQFQNTHTQDHDVYVWLRKNGSSATGADLTIGNVVGSTGLVSVPSSHGGTPGHIISGWNFVLTVAAGDYYEFMWQSEISQTYVTIQAYSIAENSQTGGTKPSTASIVLTVTPVISAVAGSGSGGSGSVTSITAESPLTGGIITTTGTIGLDQTAIGIATDQVAGLDTALAGKASTTHQSTHQAGGADEFQLGTPTAGALTGAQTFTTTTPVTNSIALLNQTLGLLVPAQPPAFPGSQSLTIGTQAVILVPQASQTLNGNPSTVQVAAGTTVRFTSSSSFTSNTLTGLGPGTEGTLTVTRDTSTAVTRALSAGNGTSTANNTSVLLTSIADYGTPTGFWKTFSSQVTGTSLVTGWHTINLAHSSAGSTTATFYNDLNTITAPVVTPTSLTITSTGTPNWSSGIPHYSGATISLVCGITNIAKDTSLISTATFISHTGVSIFGSSTKNYTYGNVSVTPTQNMTASTAVTIPVTFNPATSFGIDGAVPSVSATNVFGTGTAVSISSIFNKSIPWKTLATGTGLDELSITATNLGSTSNTRIGLNVASATPAWSGLITTWDPTVAAATNEAKVIGGLIKRDANNYTNTAFYQLPTLTGVSSYTGHAATQYFTFKFSKAGLSKFQIKLTSSTGVSGIKIALPGSALTSSLNNWIDLGINYAGAGVPGSNGSNGCNDASVTNVSTTPFTSARTLQSYQCTFGTQSTTNSTANEVYIRIELATGESISYLSLEPGV